MEWASSSLPQDKNEAGISPVKVGMITVSRWINTARPSQNGSTASIFWVEQLTDGLQIIRVPEADNETRVGFPRCSWGCKKEEKLEGARIINFSQWAP